MDRDDFVTSIGALGVALDAVRRNLAAPRPNIEELKPRISKIAQHAKALEDVLVEVSRFPESWLPADLLPAIRGLRVAFDASAAFTIVDVADIEGLQRELEECSKCIAIVVVDLDKAPASP